MRIMLRPLTLIIAGAIIISSCKKDDPKPLGAQVNAKLLAGDAGKSKGWKLRELSIQTGTNPAATQTLVGCFADNIYTFSNNATQDYAATEGTSKCNPNSPDGIENGTWSFTLDGLVINIGVDDTFSSNGLFSPEAILAQDSQGNPVAFTIGYPYPAFVSTLTDANMVLEINNTVGTTKYKYTLTFTPA